MLSKRNITECVFANLETKWWPCKKNNFNRENRLGRNEDVQVANLCTEERNPDNNKECCVKIQMDTSHIYNDMEKQYWIK